MITQRAKLNLIPGVVLPRLNVVQYDKGSRTLEFEIWNGQQRFTLTSQMTAKIQGTKPDRHGFDYSATVDTTNNIIVSNVTQQMTAAKGDAICEIVLNKGEERIGSLNFVLDIQPAALNDDTDTSDSDLPDIIAQATEQMLTAEAYAKGTRDGVPVTSGQVGYHDNSKYYKNLASTSETNAATSATAASNSATAAAQSATTADTNALKSEGFAVGKQNNVDVPSTSPYYHNNAEYYASIAGQYSVNVPHIGANGNWWVWNTTTGAYVDSGVDASITVQIADITMLAPDATPYVTNTGTDTDPIFHLFIPRGKGITSIAKTDTSGLVDTYTITYSDGATYTYTVTNGKTAYQSAVEGGYTGTEAQFEADLANFKQWRDDAVQAASDADDSADDAADEATNAHQSYLDAKTQADRAQAYADFLEPHFVIADNRLCIADDAVGEFIVADNRLCMKFVA
jgi:hypothetical protein